MVIRFILSIRILRIGYQTLMVLHSNYIILIEWKGVLIILGRSIKRCCSAHFTQKVWRNLPGFRQHRLPISSLPLKYAIIPTRRAAHWEWNYGNLHQYTNFFIYFPTISIIKFIYTTMKRKCNSSLVVLILPLILDYGFWTPLFEIPSRLRSKELRSERPHLFGTTDIGKSFQGIL